MTDNILDVILHGRIIGTLSLLAGSQTVFAFNEDYINNRARPTLSLSFKNSTGGLITDISSTHVRVPPFFANVLPEGPMRKYLARRAGVHPQREFFLLWVLGQDLPGALTVRHPDRAAGPPGSAADPASRNADAAAAVLHFSLAGVQLKFSALMAADGELTIPPTGADGSWIVKLPSPTYPAVPENEYAMLELARSVGIDVPETKLVAVDDIGGLPDDLGSLEGPAFAIRRFDRLSDGTTVHVEDFAQVFGVYPEDKYANANYRNLAEVIQAEAGTTAIKEFVRRLVFNALIGNADMHLKNWSLLYADRHSASLAPAYDFVSTIPYLRDEKMALNLYKAGTKRWSDLSIDSLSRLASRARLSEYAVLETARETVARFADTWRNGEGHGHLPTFVGQAINQHLSTLKIVQELHPA